METTKYSCIFESKSCPAKTAWKLSPESLVGFCKICVEKMKWDTLMKALEAFASIPKNIPSKELEAEKLRLEHDIEMRKMALEEKKLEFEMAQKRRSLSLKWHKKRKHETVAVNRRENGNSLQAI